MKLITWNIQWSLGMDGVMDPARVVLHAQAMADFDVLCLQEVADNFPELASNTDEDQFAAFARLLPGYVAIEGVALDIAGPEGRRKRFGNMILSRYPVAQVLRHLLPWEADATRNMPRILIEAVLVGPNGPIRVMTTHLEYSSDKLRRAQIEGIRAAHRAACARHALPREDGPGTYVRTPATPSAILTGDFNMKPDDPTLAGILAPVEAAPRLVDGWRQARGPALHPPSFCLFDQTYGAPHCCDYIFVTEDIAPRITQVRYDIETQVSDHQPVLIEIAGI